MPRKNPLSNADRKKTLLCIDDQADGLVIRQKFLEQLGYSVLIAETRVNRQQAVVAEQNGQLGPKGNVGATFTRRSCSAHERRQ